MARTAIARQKGTAGGADVRDRILTTASNLFYREGVRAVGIDLIIERAGVAKTSLYRHFPSKDHLIEAFLKREDEDFWHKWESVAAEHAADPAAELEAHFAWIEERVHRPNYRGCPQLNVAAEFSDPKHPARAVASRHKVELRKRVQAILDRMMPGANDTLAAQLALIIDGAFMSAQHLKSVRAPNMLANMARALIAADRAMPKRAR